MASNDVVKMKEEEIKSIQVMIAGRAYPLKVKAEDESKIRSVVDEINEKIKGFHMTYINRDKQDCLAMTLLTYAVDYHKATSQADQSKIIERLESLEKLLDSSIN
jgi:cell division protein ZapA (FtsZ GTPase activity inhibitor)